MENPNCSFILETPFAKEEDMFCQFGQATIIFCQISEIMKGKNSMVKLEVKPFFCIHQIPKLFFEVLFTTSMMSRCSQLMKKQRMGNLHILIIWTWNYLNISYILEKIKVA